MSTTASALKDRLRARVDGEVRVDGGSCAAYSPDLSPDDAAPLWVA